MLEMEKTRMCRWWTKMPMSECLVPCWKAAQIQAIGQDVSDTHMQMIKHAKAKSAPVMAEFTYLEQWILMST